MFYFVLSIHLLLCVLIIGLVLLQQGKGAQVGAILSGSSNTLFGAAGASSTLSKFTTGFAVALFATSVILIRIYGSAEYKNRVSSGAPKGAAGALEGTVLGEMVKKPIEEAPIPVVPAAGDSARKNAGDEEKK